MKNNYDEYYNPHKYKKYNNKILNNLRGGIFILLIKSWLFWTFIGYSVLLFVIFCVCEFDISKRSIFSSTYDSSLTPYPTLLIDNSIVVLSVIFTVIISYALNIYYSNLRRNYFNSGLYIGLLQSLLGSLKWDALNEETLNYLRNVILILSAFPYLTKYYFRGNIQLNKRLPIPPDLKSELLDKNKEKKLDRYSDLLKINIVSTKLNQNINLLIENKIIYDTYDYYSQFLVNVQTNLKEIDNDTKTSIPTIIIQSLYLLLIVVICLLLPISWSVYSYVYGTLGWIIFVIFAIVSTRGMDKIQNIFDDPENNPIIRNNNISELAHQSSAEVKQLAEFYMKKNGYKFDKYDKNSRIIKKI